MKNKIDRLLFYIIYYGLGWWLPENLLLGLDKCAEGDYGHTDVGPEAIGDMVEKDRRGDGESNDIPISRGSTETDST